MPREWEDDLAPVLGTAPIPTDPLSWAAAVLPVVALTALSIVHAVLPALATTPGGGPSTSMRCTVFILVHWPISWLSRSGRQRGPLPEHPETYIFLLCAQSLIEQDADG
ncbi:MAG: hypothetical protein HC893_13005 [Chloroflexaceae bacterium]|nr:hypothetical protein [Chloroflexaceae bacterium]